MASSKKRIFRDSRYVFMFVVSFVEHYHHVICSSIFHLKKVVISGCVVLIKFEADF